MPETPESAIVLLVEDNPTDAVLVKGLLRHHTGRPQVEHVKTLTAAKIRLLQAPAIGIILLDLGLSDSHGQATIDECLRCCKDIPIIVLTGTDDAELGRYAVRQGAQDYLVKQRIASEDLMKATTVAIDRFNATRLDRLNRSKLSTQIAALKKVVKDEVAPAANTDPPAAVAQLDQIALEIREGGVGHAPRKAADSPASQSQPAAPADRPDTGRAS